MKPQSVNQVLLNGLVTVFIRHHGYDDDCQEQFEKCGNECIEMPDVREIENTLFRQMEFYGANIEFNRGYQGYGSK